MRNLEDVLNKLKSSSGDNWDALSTQFCSVAKYVNDGDYNKAHKALDEIIVPMEKKYGRRTEQIASCINIKGICTRRKAILTGSCSAAIYPLKSII